MAIAQGNSYTMSLDSVDIANYFRQIHLPQNGLIKPLWSNIGCKENNLYEFKIHIEENHANVDNEIYYDHNFICESYTCHICNLKVPQIYMKEHNQSTKHKVCLEIANKSVERFMKQVNTDYSYHNPVVRLDSYFCPSCSAAVVTELKDHHEKTIGHLVAKKHDELLEDLLKYYLDVNKVEVDFDLGIVKELNNNTPETNEGTDKNIENKPVDVDSTKTMKTESMCSTIIAKPKIDEDITKQDANDNPGSNTVNAKEKKTNNIVNVANNNSKVSKNSTEGSDSIAVDQVDMHIPFDLIQGPAFETQANNFYSKKQDRNDEPNTTNTTKTSASKSSGKNKKKSNVNTKKTDTYKNIAVISPTSNGTTGHINNFTFKKEFDGRVDMNLKWTHETILLSDFNKMITKPGFLLNKGLKKRKITFTKLEYLQVYYSKLSTLHQLKLIDENTLKIKTVTGSVLRISVNNFHSFSEVDGKIYCKMCDELLDEDTEFHNTTPDHMMYSLIPIFDANCIRQINNTDSHCILCNEIVENNELHINTEKHAVNLQEALYSEESSDPTEIITMVYQNIKNENYCEVCEVNYGANNYTSHSKSKKHRNNYDRKFPSLSASKSQKETQENKPDVLSSTSNPNEMTCNICNVTVATKNAEEHLKGQNHVFKRNALAAGNITEQINYCNLCDINIQSVAQHFKTERHVHRVTVSISDHFRPFLLDDLHFYCIVCEDLVSNEQLKILMHLNSTCHCSKLSKMLSAHGLLKVDDQYYCPLCKQMLDGNEVKHIKSDEHVSKVNKNREETKAAIYKSEVSPENIVIHAHMETTDNPKELKCKVCLVILPFSLKHVKKHLKANSHIQCFSRLIGNFQRIGDYFACSVCHVKMDAYLLVDHLKCKVKAIEAEKVEGDGGLDTVQSCDRGTWMTLHKHMEETPLPGSLLCIVCQVYVPKNTQCVNVHVNGLKHKTKYQEVLLNNRLAKYDAEVYCNICRVLVVDDMDIEHINSELHKFMVDLAGDTPADKKLELAMHYLMKEKGKELDYLYCKICKIYVADEPLCVKNHMISNSHLAIYGAFLEKNQLTLQNHLYYCGYCKELLSKNGEYEHVFSDGHKYRVSEAEPATSATKYICETCKVEVPNNPKNITEHQLGSLHRTKLKAIQKKE